MRIRPVVTSIIASLAILGIGWKIGETEVQATTTSNVPNNTPTNSTSTTGTASNTPTSTPTATTASTPTASATTASVNGVYTGDAVQTRYGTVQVKITVKNSKVVDVATVQMSYYEGRSQQIDAQAEPILTSEAKQAGSASISTVSGATFTSDGYIQSLQSAIDKAGITS